MLLPDPDSPTMPNVFPRSREKLSDEIAGTTTPAFANPMERSSTLSSELSDFILQRFHKVEADKRRAAFFTFIGQYNIDDAIAWTECIKAPTISRVER